MPKDALGHGSNARPLAGHPFHKKTSDQLRYIIKDAGEAAHATRGMSSYDPNSGKRQDTEGKYLDQVNDAATVLGYRDRGGHSDHPDDVAARALASGSKSAPAPAHEAQTVGRHGYNPASVDKAIRNNRTGKIGSREASAIHRLLKGR